ncbi:trigger factor [Anaerosacchariphilus polymeriproducens]|uniref:Trigger factor n=1 Tax=Anaerosacchariphilus polymeriproducens TaxID=1812858 RepID=A0A371AUS9_9FIRM|nr:trigger factor [Anaerosacchariphilus polymeriproducens]RDU23326.1 trigger factor [Anaerosacchariphilus polymeriproducens]
MSLQVENLEKNMAKLTITVSAEELEKAIQGAYMKQKGKISVPGFRKGKVPRNMIEKMYGAGIFYEDAANALIPNAYEKAVEESGLDIVSQPDINVTQIEKGKEFIFTAEVAVKPEVTLGEYKGIKVEAVNVEVTDEEVEESIGQEREKNARTVTVEGRPIQDGDTAVIDYEGFADGNAFEGGKGENHPLVIGSHSFIDTFEEQLIGKSVGEDVEVNVTFPKEYHSKDLAGKEATFNVKIKEIKTKELPELDDDFAQDVSEFDTLDEYKADIKAKIIARKESEAQGKKEDEIIEKIIEGSTMDIPDPMIETQVSRMVDDFAMRIQQQGIPMEQYLQLTGMTTDALKEQMRPDALKRIQSRLVLEAIVKAENIEVSEDAVEEEIENMAKMYQMEADKLKEYMGEAEKEQMKMDLAIREAVTFVREAAKETKATKKTTAKKTTKKAADKEDTPKKTTAKRTTKKKDAEAE